MSAINRPSRSPRPKWPSWVDDAEKTWCSSCCRSWSVKQERRRSLLIATRFCNWPLRSTNPTSNPIPVGNGNWRVSVKGVPSFRVPRKRFTAKPRPAMSSRLPVILKRINFSRFRTPASIHNFFNSRKLLNSEEIVSENWVSTGKNSKIRSRRSESVIVSN